MSNENKQGVATSIPSNEASRPISCAKIVDSHKKNVNQDEKMSVLPLQKKPQKTSTLAKEEKDSKMVESTNAHDAHDISKDDKTATNSLKKEVTLVMEPTPMRAEEQKMLQDQRKVYVQSIQY